MPGRIHRRGDQSVRVLLQESDWIFRRDVAEQSDSQRGLLPGSGVAKEADLLRGQAFPYAERDRHRRDELVAIPKVR